MGLLLMFIRATLFQCYATIAIVCLNIYNKILFSSCHILFTVFLIFLSVAQNVCCFVCLYCNINNVYAFDYSFFAYLYIFVLLF